MAEHIVRLESVLKQVEAESTTTSFVVERDSGVAGPSVAILACTHGNEPVGLSAFEYLLSDFIPLKGKLSCVVANPRAAHDYFKGISSEIKEKCRYHDCNMNRLPANEGEWRKDIYEHRRALELLPILKHADAVLDLHSTSANAPPMLITLGEMEDTGILANADFPFEHIVHHVHQHIAENFLIEFCSNAKIKMLAECGQHHCLEAAQRAIDISLAFLHALGLVEGKSPPQNPAKIMQHFDVKTAIHLPRDCGEFYLRNKIAPFAFLEKGQVIACNGKEREVIIPEDGYAIMAPETANALDGSEAVLFLCDKR